MSWHGAWGRKDPFAKPAAPGDRFGIWQLVQMATSHPHYGLRASVRCTLCGHERLEVLAQLRNRLPTKHLGCLGARVGVSDPVSVPVHRTRHTRWCAKSGNPHHACTSPRECSVLSPSCPEEDAGGDG